jgi:hypothetical protein
VWKLSSKNLFEVSCPVFLAQAALMSLQTAFVSNCKRFLFPAALLQRVMRRSFS